MESGSKSVKRVESERVESESKSVKSESKSVKRARE